MHENRVHNAAQTLRKYQCEYCEKTFASVQSRSRHRIKVHDIKKGCTTEEGKFQCEYCKKTFASRQSRSKHRIRLHDVKKVVTSEKSLKFQCECCEKKFRTSGKLSRHKIKVHNIKRVCGLEEGTTTLVFSTEKDFKEWLTLEELKTNSHYREYTGERKRKNHRYLQFLCSRSGKYVSRGTGQRKLKSQGSKKIGHICTARINAKIFEDHVEVSYVQKHNHEVMLNHLPLPATVRDIIAEKVLSGVDSTSILRDLKGDIVDTDNRCHLLTRKDIQNVKSSIGILCYKEQNEDHPFLESKDFMLAVMTPIQKQMLLKFGSDVICIDSTHGTSGYGFELTTLMVIDEFEDWFPVAFCLSSTVNKNIMWHFFRCIEDKNVFVNAKVFMSDDASFIYEAWSSVFTEVEKCVLCPWHVDRAWQEQLIKIQEGKRDIIYTTLKTVLCELDVENFYFMLNAFMDELKSNVDTFEFFEYFNSYYASRCEMWAYCFRKQARIGTNLPLEHLHRELKQAYLEGEHSKRKDKCCELLRTYVLDKKKERLIKVHKGKVAKRHTKSSRRHKEQIVDKREGTSGSPTQWNIPSTECESTCTGQLVGKCEGSPTQWNVLSTECKSTCTEQLIEKGEGTNPIQWNVHPTEDQSTYAVELHDCSPCTGSFSSAKRKEPIAERTVQVNKKEKSNLVTIIDKMTRLKKMTFQQSKDISLSVKNEVLKALKDVENLLKMQNTVEHGLMESE